jgi:hypothetical protein
MDKLKTYIDRHRTEFDAEEPTAGHFERLKVKLAAQQRPTASRRVLKYWPLYSVAASVILLLSIGTVGLLFPNRPDSPPDMAATICDDPATMKYCYLDKMHDVASYIDQLTENIDPFVRETLQIEVANIIDDTQSFEKELPTELSPENAQVILVGYYQHHLETLQDIAQTLSINNT